MTTYVEHMHKHVECDAYIAFMCTDVWRVRISSNVCAFQLVPQIAPANLARPSTQSGLSLGPSGSCFAATKLTAAL